MWIAYNFLSLQGSLQFRKRLTIIRLRCELLTIFYLYKVLCSYSMVYLWMRIVVNCLQFFIFTRFFAVFSPFKLWDVLLWIAYNFLSLQGSLQYALKHCKCHLGCELLTIFYLYKVLCSKPIDDPQKLIVVNCLQFFIFTRFFAV